MQPKKFVKMGFGGSLFAWEGEECQIYEDFVAMKTHRLWIPGDEKIAFNLRVRGQTELFPILLRYMRSDTSGNTSGIYSNYICEPLLPGRCLNWGRFKAPPLPRTTIIIEAQQKIDKRLGPGGDTIYIYISIYISLYIYIKYILYKSSWSDVFSR